MPSAAKSTSHGELDLDAIVEELDPEKIDEVVGDKHADARADYKLHKKDRKAKDYRSFKDAVIKYMKHHRKAIHGVSLSDHDAFGEAHQLVDIAFRRQGEGSGAGWERAYKELARKGKVHQVLDGIASILENQERQNYVTHVFHKVDPYDFKTHTKFMGQYLNKYKAVLPSDFKTQTPEQLAQNWQELINAHVKLVSDYKDQLGEYKPALKEPGKKQHHAA